ncbi:hypothetical protein [Mycoplasmopsis bovis]|nr:hypothetical protein [Mycoplasmopsis bovis]MCA8851718.1 hypothetical protein [Mycoplasmopsis bovis]
MKTLMVLVILLKMLTHKLKIIKIMKTLMVLVILLKMLTHKLKIFKSEKIRIKKKKMTTLNTY